jgi:hypothetical protein
MVSQRLSAPASAGFTHMSVEPSELMNELWTRCQGHVINGVFTLERYLGCSDHSGVFLTESAGRRPREVAVKLVPTNRALAQAQLPRWKRAGALAHPHLVRLWEWGGCQLDGLPYLYAVMEYADQTLAQLLLHRALTDDEAREMLLPTLDALAFLHRRDRVQGQLKPENILVVGDQLKLASDTIRRVNAGTMSLNAPTVYDPPEARRGRSSTADDIWALGVCLFEALTHRPHVGSRGPREALVLPADFSPVFRDVVAGCLSPNPQDRPSAMELAVWARGRSAGYAPPGSWRSTALVAPEATLVEPAPRQTPPSPPAPAAAWAAWFMAQWAKPRALLTVTLGAVMILAFGWTGVSALRTQRTPAPPSSAVQDLRAPISRVSATEPARSEVSTSPATLREAIPEVPRSARRTLRGHISVWVRVIVDPDGSVFAAEADRAGPSRYFRRLALEAAQKWTFPPVGSPSRRLMQVQFDFSRDGTTGRAVTLD